MGYRYWLFLAGRAVSTLGDGFGTIAMGWLVYELTGSKLAMGSLYLVGMVPEITLRFVGAPIIDRVNRTRLMAILDLVQFLASIRVPDADREIIARSHEALTVAGKGQGDDSIGWS